MSRIRVAHMPTIVARVHPCRNAAAVIKPSLTSYISDKLRHSSSNCLQFGEQIGNAHARTHAHSSTECSSTYKSNALYLLFYKCKVQKILYMLHVVYVTDFCSIKFPSNRFP